uniref:NXPE C-terminal domain-containing protein n=1 Tax=Leptobrachium leishanense TaxID=445787 RepID=A0A8C5WHR7_9ANUR
MYKSILTASPYASSMLTEDELLQIKIINTISQMMPFVNFTHINSSTSAATSIASVVNMKQRYCVGDELIIKVDLYDFWGNKKTNGGDFVRARIHTRALNAEASGRIVDFKNGTYHVHFTLFWEGRVDVSLVLYHPSEGAAALWRVRNQGYGLIQFIGTFINGSQNVKSECGFELPGENLCEYNDKTDVESFYCFKPEKFPCESLTLLQSFNRKFTFLSKLETDLFKRNNIAVNIPKTFGQMNVIKCSNSSPPMREFCKIGMESPYPSGFWHKNVWNPVFCSIKRFPNKEQIYSCLNNTKIYLMGDSTLRQWHLYLLQLLNDFTNLNPRRTGRETKLAAVDLERNISLQWKKHSHPFVASHHYTVKDDDFMSEEIDRLVGGPNTIIAITLGQHFRPFPIRLFIRRVISVYRALERLFLRSPETKVIIKAENTREISTNVERLSDFHGYINDLIVKDMFKDLHVAFVDALDMTIASNSQNVHPNDKVVRNQINMFLTYIC